MSTPDLNLLVTLEVLLEEGSVAGAARRLRLSPSAMSRALSRLRETIGDPLMVRSGRGLVPTPRAIELRERVGPLVQEVRAVLRPAEALDPARLARSFTLRTTEGFVESVGPALIARTQREAPGVQLRFLPKADKEPRLLREGVVDLETGVVDREMWRDRFETGDPPAKQGRSDTEDTSARRWAQHHPQGVGLGRRTVHDRLIVRTDDEAGASDEGLAPPGSCRLFDRRTEHERGDDRPGRGDQLTLVIDRAAGVPVRLDESRQRGTGASPDGDEARHLTTAASTDSSSAAGTAVTVAGRDCCQWPAGHGQRMSTKVRRRSSLM